MVLVDTQYMNRTETIQITALYRGRPVLVLAEEGKRIQIQTTGDNVRIMWVWRSQVTR